MTRILVVDDDPNLRLALRKALRRKGVDVVEAKDGSEAIAPLLRGATADGDPIDACVLDLRMPMSGLEVLRRTQQREVPVIVLTGHGSIPDAVEAMRLGASNFVQKPVDADELWPVLEQAMAPASIETGEILGESAALRTFLQDLERAAHADEPVLLLGETGTGKELAARRLHESSPRSGSPFVAFNAACVPFDLFESELFGHKKGAFTGAERDREGLMAQAGDGTLFLDEIGDLSLEAQVKLLRALEERKFRPVGADGDRPFRARIVAATHQALPRMVERGKFRADLFYRLSVLPLSLPPLRERSDDAVHIARAWLQRLSGKRALSLEESGAEALRAYRFPGNVRELINLLKRAAIFAPRPEIDGDTLDDLLANSPFAHTEEAQSAPSGRRVGPAAGDRVTLEELERTHITRLLEELDNVSEVARIVGIDRRTLQRKMIAWGLRED